MRRSCWVLLFVVIGCVGSGTFDRSAPKTVARPSSRPPGDASATPAEALIPPPDATTAAGCSCGSNDEGKPCMGSRVAYERGDDYPSRIEFSFECDGGQCACGLFANGYDFWVAPTNPGGTVKLTQMLPEATGAADSSLRNGWVANPSATVKSTLMDGRLGDMKGTGLPINPTTSDPATFDTSETSVVTVVKSHSMLETGDSKCGGTDRATRLSRHCFWHAGVLTVLSKVPPNAGRTVLRPPITGPEKPMHDVSLIDFDALPSLPLPKRADGSVVEGPSWDEALDLMAPPKVEWGASGGVTYWQYMPPMYNFSSHRSGYPPRSMAALLDAMQLLALNARGEEGKKRLLAIRSVQWGLDYYYMWKARGYGAMYKPKGGHAVGRYLPTVIAAALLTGEIGEQAKADLMRVNNGTGDKCGFDIPGELFHWEDTGRVLYGNFNIEGCSGYSDYTKQTNSNYVDPAHIGDNGRLAENKDNDFGDVNSCFGAYQRITLGPTHSTANLVRAIPAARAIAYKHMIPYVSRMFDLGAYCRRDQSSSGTSVQAFGTCAGGKFKGEQCRSQRDCDGEKCLGENNQYTSWLARNMWANYKDCYDDNSCPGM